MEVSGYKIRGTLKTLEMKLQAEIRNFTASLVKYPSEAKPHPRDVMLLIKELEGKIAKLQAIQSAYNIHVIVDVLGQTMTLGEAVKQLGGANRMVALWKRASGATSNNNRYQPDVYENLHIQARELDKEYVVRQVSDNEATNLAIEAEKFASALRNAIAEGNGVKVDLTLDPSLLSE